MPDTKATPDEARPYVWISADHVQDVHELHQIMVAVDPDSGAVLDPQPDYPTDPEPEAPPPEADASARHSGKSSS